jgi:sigma-B regulation protein RsbQ
MDARRRNNVTVLGQGSPAIVLGHGVGWDQTTWRHVAPRLARDHRVVLFDYIGCGKSDRSAFAADRYKKLTGHARDVVEIGEALALDRAVFVGHSVSG